MPPISKTPIKLAILDDYQNIALPYFESLKPTFDITVFNDTLLPFNHPSTPQSSKDALITRLKPFTVISSMRERTPFPAALLKSLPNLKLLLTTGHRNAAIDLVTAKELHIPVAGAVGKPSFNAKKIKGPDSTTQHTVALILALARDIPSSDASIKSSSPAWQSSLATGLAGKKFSTLGLGRLGGAVGRILYLSFGMRVLCWSSSLTQDKADERAKELGLPIEDEDGKVFKVVSKEELFKEADLLSVHYVLSDRSRGIVGKEDLALMKKSAFLVNTSRGPLVDEASLVQVLEEGKIAGAALDVFEIEPLGESPWRSDKWGKEGKGRVVVTPHMGYVEEETLGGWYEGQVDNLQRWVKGEELLHILS